MSGPSVYYCGRISYLIPCETKILSSKGDTGKGTQTILSLTRTRMIVNMVGVPRSFGVLLKGSLGVRCWVEQGIDTGRRVPLLIFVPMVGVSHYFRSTPLFYMCL